MSGSSSIPVINPKRASTADVRKALQALTGDEKWTNDEYWAYFLVLSLIPIHISHPYTNLQKHRLALFTDIATKNLKNWDDPDVGKQIDSAFKAQASALPEWAWPVANYPKIAEWMRRQHWKHNKNKPPLANSADEGALMSQAADAERDEGDWGDQGEAAAGGFWKDVM
jgi:hypothetical protein